MNYMENLLSRITTLRDNLNSDDPTMATLTDTQRDALSSIVDVLKYSLEAYENSGYGCCHEIQEIEACFDAPNGFNTPELLEKVSFLINFSNLGIANVPKNSQFSRWYNSVDNNMTRALVGEYILPIVDWAFEGLRLEKPSNDNTQLLTYSLAAFVIYVVFGDPVLMVEPSSGLLERDSFDKILDSIAKDMFAQDVDNWQGVLSKLNQSLTSELTTEQAEKVTITEDDVHELFSWILVNLQRTLNQTDDKEDCSTEFGLSFPGYPGSLWILANTALAVFGSFLIAGSKGRFGKKVNGDVKWIPDFGIKDTTDAEFTPLFGDTRSPFRGFSIRNTYIDKDMPSKVIVQFSEEVTDKNFVFNHASIDNPSSYDVSLKRLNPESVTVCNVSVSAHQSEHDRAVLTLDVGDASLFDGEYGTDYVLKLRSGGDAQETLYNDDGELDAAPAWTQNWQSDGARREISLQGDSSGPKLADFMRWAMDIGDDTLGKCALYLINWHNRNLQPEFNDAYVALQSIGWMNKKGSDFAGFLHPDSMCGPYIEQLFSQYYKTVQEDCVKVKIEASCGEFDCSSPKWSATCPDVDNTIVTMLSRSTIGTNDAAEAGFLFAKTEEVVSLNVESGVSLCVIDCAECGNQNCPPELIASLEADIASTTSDLEQYTADKEDKEIEVGEAQLNVGLVESDLAQATDNRNLLLAMIDGYNAIRQDFLDYGCGDELSAPTDCQVFQTQLEQIESDIMSLGLLCNDEGGNLPLDQDGKIIINDCVNFVQNIVASLEADLASALTELSDAQAALQQIVENIEAAQASIDALTKMLEDCNCEDCVNGPWKIIRQGTDASNYSAECLIGWDYSDVGDIVIDESKPAYGAKTISLSSKPETLLIDKSGDIYADGVKVARVALCGLVNTSFTSLFDPDLPLLMIHPKYIGDKRIFHIMQEGFAIDEENANSLRNELKRHEILPYPIGRFFQGDPCCDEEPEECLEEACCRNPDLPDCFDLGECGGVTIPQWFKAWYEEHRDYLILKLPHDRRYPGDPMRYSEDEQVLFARALIDLIVRYFNSTPFTISNGFENWNEMTRQLNILPLISKDGGSTSKFNFADWFVGKNSNSPEVVYAAVDENCLDCCDDLLDSCDVLAEFDDCCESSCGRWNQDCDYKTGDIVTGISGEFCYEALIDICAGECNPVPGSAGSEEIWFRCTPDCETEVPSTDFIVSNNYICTPDGCDALIGVALQYTSPENPNLCEYRWIFTATNVSDESIVPITVEHFGKEPLAPYTQVTLPLLSTTCSSGENPNVWAFRLEARSSISDEVLSSTLSDSVDITVSCDFDILIWDELDAARAEAYGWCDEQSEDNPNGQRASSPESALGDAMDDYEQIVENMLKQVDGNENATIGNVVFNNLMQASQDIKSALLLAPGLPNPDVVEQNLDLILNNMQSDWDNGLNSTSRMLQAVGAFYSEVEKVAVDYGIYMGTRECCCVVLTSENYEENSCEFSWLWLVDSGVGEAIPYSGGVGKKPAETVACAIRNPMNEDDETQVFVRLLSYPSTCDDYLQSAISNWNGQPWSSYFSVEEVCSCDEMTVITCPCAPRQGIANLALIRCNNQDDSLYEIELYHTNMFNTCEADWTWQIQDLTSGGSVTTHSAGQGLWATPLNINLNAGSEYKFDLIWNNPAGGNSGNAFSQTITIPYCPKLDLTHNFSDTNFTETEYGQFTVDDYTHGPAVSENDGANQITNFSLNITNHNASGSFTISANHTPDESDPQWLAIDESQYQFRWMVEAFSVDGQGGLTSVGSFMTEPANLELSTTYPTKGRVPSLEEQMPENMVSYGNLYSVRLMAAKNGAPDGDNTVGPLLNSRYKGTRSIEFSTTSAHIGRDYLAITPSGSGEFRPKVNFHGPIQETKTFYGRLEDGTQTSGGSYSLEFNVADDPCSVSIPSLNTVTVIDAPILESSETGGLVTVSFDMDFLLSNECQLTMDSVNPTTINFVTDLRKEGGQLGNVISSPIWNWNSVSGGGYIITATFTEEVWVPTTYDGSSYGSVGIRVTSTDNQIAQATYTEVSAFDHDLQLGLPQYRQCTNGQYVLSDTDGNDGQPEGCPCVVPQLDSGFTWSGTNSNEITVNPVTSNDGNTAQVSLSQFIDGSSNWGFREISTNGAYDDFSTSVGGGKIHITCNDNLVAGSAKTLEVTVSAFNTDRFGQNHAQAASEGCNVEFIVSMDMIAGCISEGAVDYVPGANIQPLNLDCSYAAPTLKSDVSGFINIDDGNGVVTITQGQDLVTIRLNEDVFGSLDYNPSNSVYLKGLVDFTGAADVPSGYDPNNGATITYASSYEVSYHLRGAPYGVTNATLPLYYGEHGTSSSDQKINTQNKTKGTNPEYTYGMTNGTLIWDVTVRHVNEHKANNGAEYTFVLESIVDDQVIPCYVPDLKVKGSVGSGGIYHKLHNQISAAIGAKTEYFDISKVDFSEATPIATEDEFYIVRFTDGFFKLKSNTGSKIEVVVNLEDFFNDPVGAESLTKSYSGGVAINPVTGNSITGDTFVIALDSDFASPNSGLALAAPVVDSAEGTATSTAANITDYVLTFRASYSDCSDWDSETVKIQFILDDQTWTAGCEDDAAANSGDYEYVDNSLCCYTPTLKNDEIIITNMMADLQDDLLATNSNPSDPSASGVYYTTTGSDRQRMASPSTYIDNSKIGITATTSGGDKKFVVTFKKGFFKDGAHLNTYSPDHLGAICGYRIRSLFDNVSSYDSQNDDGFRTDLTVSANSCGPCSDNYPAEPNGSTNFRLGDAEYSRTLLSSSGLNNDQKVWAPAYPSVVWTYDAYFLNCATQKTRVLVEMVVEDQEFEAACGDKNSLNHEGSQYSDVVWRQDNGVCINPECCFDVDLIKFSPMGIEVQGHDLSKHSPPLAPETYITDKWHYDVAVGMKIINASGDNNWSFENSKSQEPWHGGFGIYECSDKELSSYSKPVSQISLDKTIYETEAKGAFENAAVPIPTGLIAAQQGRARYNNLAYLIENSRGIVFRNVPGGTMDLNYVSISDGDDVARKITEATQQFLAKYFEKLSNYDAQTGFKQVDCLELSLMINNLSDDLEYMGKNVSVELCQEAKDRFALWANHYFTGPAVTELVTRYNQVVSSWVVALNITGWDKTNLENWLMSGYISSESQAGQCSTTFTNGSNIFESDISEDPRNGTEGGFTFIGT